MLALHSQRLQLNAELEASAHEAQDLRHQAEAAQQSFQQLQAQCSFDLGATDGLQAQIHDLQQHCAQLAVELQSQQGLQEAHGRLCHQNEQLASDLQTACSAADAQAASAAAHLQDLQSQLESSRMREDQQVTGLMSELQAANAEVWRLKTRLESRSPRGRSPSPRQPESASAPTPAELASIQASDSKQPPVSEIVRTLEMGRVTPCKKCMQHAAVDNDMSQRLEFILADRERLLSDRAAAEAQLQVAEQALELQQIRHAEVLDQVFHLPSAAALTHCTPF